MIDFSFPASELEYFLLVLTRISLFVYIAPFFSINSVPNRVKIAFSVFLSFLIYNITFPHEVPEYETLLQYSIIVLREATTGILLGFGASVSTSVVNFAGRIVDMEIGMSMASVMDPTTRENTTITGVLYQYGFMLILVCTGFYRYLISALAESYTLIPVGMAAFDLDAINTTLLRFMSEYMLLGFRIALPVVATIMMLNAVLAILAKVAPQMNMFAVGMQLKVMTGFIILFLTIGMMPTISDMILNLIKSMVKSFAEAMM